MELSDHFDQLEGLMHVIMPFPFKEGNIFVELQFLHSREVEGDLEELQNAHSPPSLCISKYVHLRHFCRPTHPVAPNHVICTLFCRFYSKKIIFIQERGDNIRN